MRRALSLLPMLLVLGCDDPPKKGAAASASASAEAAPAQTQAPPKPASMPSISVDSDGPYIGGSRVNMTEQGAAEKLTKIIKGLPINSQQVTIIADKKAKIPHVAAVVAELGEAGAPKVLIKTDGRNDLPKEITVTPPNRISSPPACSVTVMVLKDLSTAVWPFKGGLGKRQRKGFAGPDLSHTGETLEKDLPACDSTMAFFSSEETVAWELAFNLAGTVLVSDKKKKIDTLVLLRDEPVAGRPVVLKK